MTQAAIATVESKSNVWSGGRSPFHLSYGKVMMWLFLLSDAFTFSGLLISMGMTRFNHKVWPDPNLVFHAFPFAPEHANLPLMFVSLMTFILIVSSVTMVLAVNAGHNNDKNAVIKWLFWTIVGGIAFLSCQAWEWTHLYHSGAWWGSFGPLEKLDPHRIEHFFNLQKPGVADVLHTDPSAAYSSTHEFFNFFFTITGFHGAHVTSGVVLNIIILLNTINGTYEKRGHYEMVEKVGLYWHFVDLVWVFVFTCFYLL